MKRKITVCLCAIISFIILYNVAVIGISLVSERFRKLYFSGWASRKSIFLVADIGSRMVGESAYGVLGDCYIALANDFRDANKTVMLTSKEMHLFSIAHSAYETISSPRISSEGIQMENEYEALVRRISVK